MMSELSYTSPPLRRALGKPILTVLKWQFAVTVLATLVAALIAGVHAAASAAAGGAVSMVAGLASALVAVLGKGNSAGGVVTMLIFSMAFFVREY